MVAKGFWTNGKAIIVQTIILLVMLFGIAMTAERRITLVETELKNEREIRIAKEIVLMGTIKEIQDNQAKLIEITTRLATLVDVMDKRHTLEDSKK